MSGASGLRLHAVDGDDLQVFAAYLQDSVARVADMAYLPQKRRFAVAVNRFKWEDVQGGPGPQADANAPYRRVRTAVHFDSVLWAKTQGVNLADKDAVLNLLTLYWEPGEEGAGAVTLTFSGQAAVRLGVECIDGWLTDISAPWPTGQIPLHGNGSDAEPLG